MQASGILLKILKRDNFRCQLCGCKNTIKNKLQVHHIIPISDKLQGHADMNNLIISDL